MLRFLWRQWSALGVLGEAKPEDNWIVDPEPLLIFTLDMARHEPRLFDEVMGWLVKNGKWILIQKLRGIMRQEDFKDCQLVGAVSAWLSSQGQERKWQNLAEFCQKKVSPSQEDLFIYRKGELYLSQQDEGDQSFAQFGFYRSSLGPSRKSREVIPTARSNLRFMLRALFGVGSRAECILYLLTHDGGHPSDVAKAIGLSIKGIQDALIELSKSGLILTRIKGKKKIEYWLSQKQWWEFLSKGSIEELEKPVWIDWIALFRALSKVWETLNEIETTQSNYLRSSKLRESMELVGNEFARSGVDIPLVPGREVRPENYEEAFKQFIIKVFGVD